MNLTPFTYGDREFRVVEQDGEPWFVASDVAKILGYRDAEKMTRRLDEDERGTRSVGTPGGTQQMTCITEAGLYAAILGSQVEGARLFKRWVTHEVLPQIRKTGSYGQAQIPYTGPELVAAALIESQKMLEQREHRIKELEPKATSWERFISSEGDMSVSEAAKTLSRAGTPIGRNRLFEVMDLPRDQGGLGWFFRNGHGQREAYQAQVELGRVRMKAGTYESATSGNVHPFTTPRLTAKGLDAIAKHLKASEVTA